MSKVPKKSVLKEKVNVAVPKKPRVTPPKGCMSIMVTLWGDFSLSWAVGFTVKEKNYPLFVIYKKILVVCNSIQDFFGWHIYFISDLSHMLLVRLFLIIYIFLNALNITKMNAGFFKVPEVPKKIPEEKVPIAVPKKPEPTPAKGMLLYR